jgi:DGQHR domain-containing protein
MRDFRLTPVKETVVVEVPTEREAREYERKGYRRSPYRSHGKIVLKKKRTKWEKFEEEIRSFLRDLGFLDTEGAGGELGKYQIDAWGGLGSTFLVIDCVVKNEPGFKSLRQKILALAGKSSELKREVRRKYGYNEVKFVLATKDIEVTREDEELARRKRVKIWEDSYIDMNKKLFKSAGNLVAYWILRELDAKPIYIDKSEGYLEIPAFKVRESNGFRYTFEISALALAQLGYVPRILSTRGGYQRILYPAKVTKIAKYIEDGGQIPNNIIVNCDHLEFTCTQKLSDDLEYGMVRIPKIYASVEIIDGQHRVYGFWKANVSRHLSVTAYKGMKFSEQAEMYETINRTQKPVEANEIWALYPTTEPSSVEAWITKLAIKLNEEGIFKNKIYIPGVSKRPRKAYSLYLANLCDGIRKHSRLVHYFHIDDSTPQKVKEEALKKAHKIINEFFRFIIKRSKKYSRKWESGFCLTNNGSVVMLRLLRYLLDYLHSCGIDPARNLRKVRQNLSILEKGLNGFFSSRKSDINELIRETSSEGGRVDLAARIGVSIAEDYPGFGGNEVAKKIAEPPFKILQDFETKLRNCIITSLKKKKEKWEEAIPSSILERARMKEKSEREKGLPPRDNLLCYVEFSDYKGIIYENWDVFKEVFGDKAFVKKIEELEPIRNILYHNARALRDEEMRRLELYVGDLLQKIQTKRNINSKAGTEMASLSDENFPKDVYGLN